VQGEIISEGTGIKFFRGKKAVLGGDFRETHFYKERR
jgi:hypothetical protein